MPRRIHIDLLPKTPRGCNFDYHGIEADEVEIDDEIAIKSTLFQECRPGNPWFEEAIPNQQQEPKILARKSTDLRKFRSAKSRVEAILSSPMVDARRRSNLSMSYSEGFNLAEGDIQSPLQLPGRKDLVRTTSRRISRIVLNRGSLSEPIPAKRTSGKLDSAIGMPELSAASTVKTPLRASGENVPPDNSLCPGPRLNFSPHPVSPLGERNDGGESSNEKSMDVTTSTSPNEPKSVAGFRLLSTLESTRLTSLCNDWTVIMYEEKDKIPEKAVDAIRTVVCKCQLLLSKKFPFFNELVETAERQQTSHQENDQAVGVNDLLGYWSLVADEINLADAAFERLNVWREQSGWALDKQPMTPARPMQSKPRKGTVKRLLPSEKTKRSQVSATPGRPVPLTQIDETKAVDIGKALKKATPKSVKKNGRSKFAEFREQLRAKQSRKGTPASTSKNSTSPILRASFVPTVSPINQTKSVSNPVAERSLNAEKLEASRASAALKSPSMLTPSSTMGKKSSTTAPESDKQWAVPKHCVRSSGKRFIRSSGRSSTLTQTSGYVSSTPTTSKTGSMLGELVTPDSYTECVAQRTPFSRPGTPRPKLTGSKLYASTVARSVVTFASFSGEHQKASEPQGARQSSDTKHVSFSSHLSRTPGGHDGGSGSPRPALPVTPANISGDDGPRSRVRRRRRSILSMISPLGLRPVTNSSSPDDKK